jgi:hypothetical protein
MSISPFFPVFPRFFSSFYLFILLIILTYFFQLKENVSPGQHVITITPTATSEKIILAWVIMP